jgi:hypothetical protein
VYPLRSVLGRTRGAVGEEEQGSHTPPPGCAQFAPAVASVHHTRGGAARSASISLATQPFALLVLRLCASGLQSLLIAGLFLCGSAWVCMLFVAGAPGAAYLMRPSCGES